jgi:hypothetical protein
MDQEANRKGTIRAPAVNDVTICVERHLALIA